LTEHLAENVVGRGVTVFELLDLRTDLLVDELADRDTHHLLFLRPFEHVAPPSGRPHAGVAGNRIPPLDQTVKFPGGRDAHSTFVRRSPRRLEGTDPPRPRADHVDHAPKPLKPPASSHPNEPHDGRRRSFRDSRPPSRTER